ARFVATGFFVNPWREEVMEHQSGQAPVRALYCALFRGTTESLPCRTSGESENREFDLISARETGLLKALPALILTAGFLGFEVLTETTVAVPTVLLRSAVS